VPTWGTSSEDGHGSEQDRNERKRTPPMLPERSDAMSALSPSPEQTEHNQESPDNATDARHVQSLARSNDRQNQPASETTRALRSWVPSFGLRVAPIRQVRPRLALRSRRL